MSPNLKLKPGLLILTHQFVSQQQKYFVTKTRYHGKTIFLISCYKKNIKISTLFILTILRFDNKIRI